MKENLNKRTIIKYLVVILYALLLYYLTLPALNLHSLDLYFYVFMVMVVFMIMTIPELFDFRKSRLDFKKNIKKMGWKFIVGIIIVGGVTIVNIFYSPLLNPKKYANRIEVNKEKTFTDDIEIVNFKALPLLDKDSSQKLGDRVMGQMPELVSQFYVSNLYTQINYNDSILRVTPLEYANWIKYFTNQKEGVKGYITVDSVSGESKLTKLNKGMKIMPSALFGKDLYRTLRFKYPTLIFGKETFEIDNEGNPFWIVPIIKYKGVGLLRDIIGIISLDPITGKSIKYSLDQVPTWIDHVFQSELIIEQFDDWGLYQEGFFNSIFGQKGVVQTTDGYNYTVMNNDVFLYTGVTSISSDEANLGFILTNLRTKETNFYSAPGAEEYSAMASAEGQVQQMSYTSSFPLLINLNNRPTYLISLKDNAGLVKMYAFVDVVDYQKVVVSDSSLGIEKAAQKFLDSFVPSVDNEKINTKIITITSIKTGIIEGNTYYYVIDQDNQKYRISLKLAESILPFLKVDDKLEVNFKNVKDLIEVIEIIK